MTFAPQQEELRGTIEEVLSHDIVHEVNNDGDHTYLHIQQEAKTQLPVTNEAMHVTVPLTNPELDVVQFDKSFITLKVGLDVGISGYTSAASGIVNQAIPVFIGLKHSTDCIGEYSVYHKGKQISGTLQSNATTESFLYHTYRSEDDLLNRRGTHTVARYAAEGNTSSVCGEYVSIADLKTAQGQTGSKIRMNFKFNIPFNDILAFQQFEGYPASLFGELELKFKFNKHAFVVLQCNPLKTIRGYAAHNSTYTGLDVIANPVVADSTKYTKEFTQIGDSFTGIITASITSDVYNSSTNKYPNSLQLTTGTVTLTPGDISIDECFSTLIGYKIRPDAREALRDKFENEPWVKFSQNVNFLPFSAAPGTSKVSLTQQTYLNNTTDFVLLFPRTQHESGGTVYKNPMLQDLSLTVMNRKYPEMPLDTSSARFAKIMLNASDLFHNTPLREYAQSISVARYDSNAKSYPSEDLSCFIITLKVERPSAMGLICDGLDSKGQQTSVRLEAKPIVTNNAIDEYCTQNLGVAPILVTVNDSYFIFNSKDGGQCLHSDKEFNEVLPSFMGM